MNQEIEKARAKFRERLDSHEFWILTAHRDCADVFKVIRGRYYRDAPPEDFETLCEDPRFRTVAARKRRMLGYQLASILRQCTPVRISDKGILQRDVVIIAPPEVLLALAMEVAHLAGDQRKHSLQNGQ